MAVLEWIFGIALGFVVLGLILIALAAYFHQARANINYTLRYPFTKRAFVFRVTTTYTSSEIDIRFFDKIA